MIGEDEDYKISEWLRKEATEVTSNVILGIQMLKVEMRNSI